MEFQVAIRIHDKHFLFEDRNVLSNFIFVKNPFMHWLADPFVLEYRGEHYLFVESANRITGKGHLLYTKINENITTKYKWKVLMKKKFHLSFPNVFVEDNRLKMIPETYQDGCIAIYECLGKMENWKKNDVVVGGSAFVDTIQYNDLFITYDISCDLCKLKLFSSDGSILDSIDDTSFSLRPAGKLIYNDNQAIFVSQKCQKIYGEGLVFQRINILENGKMKIKRLFEINYSDLNSTFKSNDFVGIHTYNFDECFEVIDVRKTRFNLFGLIGKIIDKLKKRKKA